MIISLILKQIENTNNYMKKLEGLQELMTKVNELVKENNISKCEIETIIEALEDEGLEVRTCTNCGELMDEGYIVNGGVEYHCSDECLHEEVTAEEWKKLTAYLTEEDKRTEEQQAWFEEYGVTESYWTQWN